MMFNFIFSLDIYSDDHSQVSFPGKRQLISFLSWLDYVNSLCKEAHPVSNFPKHRFQIFDKAAVK